jgi:tellurite resistance protein TerC
MLGRFRYLKIGLGSVLAFVGAKMLLADLVHVPIALSLGIVGSLLGCSILASVLFPGNGSEHPKV